MENQYRIGKVFFISLVAVAFVNVSSFTPSNITVGSSISTSPNQSSYWLSESTNFAFGFYPVSNHQHVIGIWLTRTKARTLVWTANHHDSPFPDTNSSLILDHNGSFMMRSKGNEAKPLFTGNHSAWYALMQDNGNLVIYGSDSSMIWQSFDHPTDTILAGQVLKPGQVLFDYPSKRYKLSMQQDGDVVISDVHGGNQVWSSKTGKKSNNATLSLDSDGHLYLADSGIIKNFTNGGATDGSSTGYRATLDSNGSFSLYMETEESHEIWYTSNDESYDSGHELICLGFACVVTVGITLICVCVRKHNGIHEFFTREYGVVRGFFVRGDDKS